MRRRRLVAIAGTAGLSAISGCLDDGSDADDGPGNGVDDSPPFEIRTVDAPGSEAGTVQIPQDGRVMLINFTRTQCPTSEGLLSQIDAARDDLEDSVFVISVIDGTSGPTSSADELADWWIEHDGNWTVGLDEDGALNDYYDISGIPVLIAIDGAGEIHWQNSGTTTAGNIVSGVEKAVAAHNESTSESDESATGANESTSETDESASGANESTTETD